MSDIKNFCEDGGGFLQDNTSAKRIDMREQIRREKRKKRNNELNQDEIEK